MGSGKFDVDFVPGISPESNGWPGPAHEVLTDAGMRIERNVPVRMRDGLKLLVDVFRPASDLDAKQPVILAWAPYGKHGALHWSTWPGHEVDVSKLSKYVCFETPDPAYWAAHGFATVMADARGTWGSEGDVTLLGPEEAEACYDLIEWIGSQPWSNGRVGMTGVSYYAAIQWRVAALRPPHLAAINPWEGFHDTYYEVANHGGIPETHFLAQLAPLIASTHGRVEDLATMRAKHPHYDAYWRSKVAVLEDIDVPAYVVASWTDHGLHTRGTLEGFRRISSPSKWLEVHGRKKWAYYYQPDSLARQTAFFDRFLKGKENTVTTWPQVRLEIRERANHGVVRAESEWPLGRTKYTKLHLHGSGSLSRESGATEETIAYDAKNGRAHFDFTVPEETELTGYAKLRLWVEARGASDLDLFVALLKLDARGEPVPFPFFSTFDDGPAALGWLRVSARELREDATPEQPRYTFSKKQPLAPGEIVPVEIEIWPSSTLLRQGETLRLVVQGHDLKIYEEKRHHQRHDPTVNAGEHVLHLGGRYDSHLLVPVIPPK